MLSVPSGVSSLSAGGQPPSDTSSGVGMYMLESRYLYTRNSRSIGVLWAIFSLCFAIINVVVFVQPQWLGDTTTSPGTGYFGLWRSCRLLQDGQDLICEGRLDDFGSIQTPAFKAATVFVGLSVCLSSLCVASLVLFFFMHSSTVFHVCGWMQLSCAISMLVGVLVFPLGWDTAAVREVCGNESDSFALGQCGIRWAFILAIIGIVDCVVLSVLAFVLGTRYVKLLPDQYLPNGPKCKGEVNSGFNPHDYYQNKKLMGGPLGPPGGVGGGFMAGGAKLSSVAAHPANYVSTFMAPLPPPSASAVAGNNGLHEVERYSEYSQRTSRSSYKSGSGHNQPSSAHTATTSTRVGSVFGPTTGSNSQHSSSPPQPAHHFSANHSYHF